MKRILSALAATASIAALTLGAAGTANATGQQQPFDLYIQEVSTGPEFRDYIKIAPVGGAMTLPTSVDVKATFGGQSITLTTIPAGTVFAPDCVYTIAHVGSGIQCAMQVFSLNLPEDFPVRVTLHEKVSPHIVLDSALIPPLPDFVPQVWSQHRVSPASTAFTPAPAAPCAPRL